MSTVVILRAQIELGYNNGVVAHIPTKFTVTVPDLANLLSNKPCSEDDILRESHRNRPEREYGQYPAIRSGKRDAKIGELTPHRFETKCENSHCHSDNQAYAGHQETDGCGHKVLERYIRGT